MVGSASISSQFAYGPDKPPPISHEDVDAMAAKLPEGRTDDFGRVLNEKERRFFAVREAGYKGPFNWTIGYPVHEDDVPGNEAPGNPSGGTQMTPLTDKFLEENADKGPWPEYEGQGAPGSPKMDHPVGTRKNPYPKPPWNMTEDQRRDHDYDQVASGVNIWPDKVQAAEGWVKDKLAGKS